MLYRGQAYGDPVGEWWTSSRDDATSFAMSRGGNRTYVVLELDEDDPAWLAPFVFVERSECTWYRIPIARLAERWRGVKIATGAIAIPGADLATPSTPQA